MPLQVHIEGKPVDVPTVDELDLDEWIVVREKSGFKTIPEFAEAVRGIDPLAWRTLIEIGLTRAGPEYANLAVGSVNLIALVNAITADVEPEEANGGPPELEADPANPSSETTPERSGLPV